MRIVFLDIDGVLNTLEYCSSFPGRRDEWHATHPEIMWAMAEDLACLDPAKVKLLEDLVQRADANIVFSTSWAWNNSVSTLATMLHLQGLTEPQRCIGATCMESLKIKLDRTESILYWLSRVPVDGYVALDDQHLDLPGHFIRTDQNKGLLPEHLDEALRILL